MDLKKFRKWLSLEIFHGTRCASRFQNGQAKIFSWNLAILKFATNIKLFFNTRYQNHPKLKFSGRYEITPHHISQKLQMAQFKGKTIVGLF